MLSTSSSAATAPLVASLIALGAAIHALEGLACPPSLPLRLGLANAVVVLAMVRYGAALAGRVAVGRVLLSSLIWGSLLQPAFLLSLAGALASWLAMSLLHRLLGGAVSALGLSWSGAAAHLAGQCAVLALLTPFPVVTLTPYLALLALVSGGIVGALCVSTLRHLPPREACHA